MYAPGGIIFPVPPAGNRNTSFRVIQEIGAGARIDLWHYAEAAEIEPVTKSCRKGYHNHIFCRTVLIFISDIITNEPLTREKPETQAQAVNVDRFIDGMRNVPSVVTVVTMGDDSGAWGITIGSFVSLSLDPPLICFNVQRSIRIHDPIVKADRYVVHVLREDQADLSDLFASSEMPREQQFNNVEYTMESGCPVLKDAFIRFHCSRHDVLSGGDHSILLGLVNDVTRGTAGRPVVYHRRAYHGIGQHIADHK